MAKCRRMDAGQTLAAGMVVIRGFLGRGLDLGCLRYMKRQVRRAADAAALTRDEQGQSLVELAVVFPVLMMVLLGVIAFGLALSQYLMLTNGTNMAAQQLAVSRLQTADPCQTAYTAFHNASPTLNVNNLKFTVQIWTSLSASTTYGPMAGGATTTCTAGAPLLTAGYQSSLTVTYLSQLNFFGFRFCPSAGCTLTSTTSEVVQ